MRKYIFLALGVVLVSITGCEKDNGNQQEEENKPITNLVAEIKYPSGEYSYNRDPFRFEYENGKLVKSFNYMSNVVYSYPSPNIIQTESINPNLSNATEKSKSVYYFSENKIQYVVSERSFKFNDPNRKEEIVKDSTIFQYQGEHLSKIVGYTKGDVNYYYSYLDYKVAGETVVFWENENISKIQYYEKGMLEAEKTYQYDNTPYLTYGEFSFETPFDELGSFILYGKLGKWNKNNVISMANTHRPAYGYGFKNLRYRRELDSHNRVIKIHTEGEVIGALDSHEYHGKYFKGENPARITYH